MKDPIKEASKRPRQLNCSTSGLVESTTKTNMSDFSDLQNHLKD